MRSVFTFSCRVQFACASAPIITDNQRDLLWIWVSARLLTVTQRCLSTNTVCGRPWVLSALIQRFIALLVQLCGDYIMHRGALSIQKPISLFYYLISAQWKDCLSVCRCGRGPVEALERIRLFSYHSRNSAHDPFFFFLGGAVTLIHSLWQVHRCTLFSFVNINWIPESYATPFKCSAASQRQMQVVKINFN